MCGRIAHRVAALGHGAVASLPVLAVMDGQPAAARVAVTVACAAGAAPMAGGRWSPDVDQYKIWKRVDRVIPDEWLGAGGPLRHRGITHWWGIPATATGAVWWLAHQVPGPVAVLLVLAAWMPLTGWWSHLLSDLVVGARYRGGRRAEADEVHAWDRKSMLDADDEPRGPGIPLAPWWWHVGVGWRVGSGGEWVWVLGSLTAGVAAIGVAALG